MDKSLTLHFHEMEIFSLNGKQGFGETGFGETGFGEAGFGETGFGEAGGYLPGSVRE